MSHVPLPVANGGEISAENVARFLNASGISIEQLMLELVPIAQKAAIPAISNFFVGAVGLGASGSLYFGANYEFTGQALSFSVHAEQAATVNAISHGESGLLKLAVSAAPCGYCRQFLYELTTASKLEIIVPKTPTAALTSLLPSAFGPADLGVAAALMSPQAHGMTVESGGDEPLVAAALAAANASYAPYTFDYAGVALQTKDGRIFSGSVAENAAFNPSMSPMEAAVVSLAISGGKAYEDVADAVLVEAASGKANQVTAARAVLDAMTSGGVTLRVLRAHLPRTERE